MPRRPSPLHRQLLAACFVTLGVCAYAAQPTDTKIKDPGTNNGKWSDSNTWQGGGQVPNNSGGSSFNTQITSGTVELDAEVTVTSVLIDTGSGGGLSTSATTTGNQGKKLTLSGQGSSWKSGSLLGTNGVGELVITSTGATTTPDFAITTSAEKTLNNWSLKNSGKVVWDGGTITTGNGASIHNNTTGVFETSFDGNLTFDTTGTRTTFNNAGTFKKTAGATGSETRIEAAFENTGTLSVDAGKLKLAGGGSSSGNVTVAGTLELGDNAFSFAGGVLNGAGSIDLVGSTTSFSGTSGSANISVAGGTASFAGAHAGTGKLSLSSGTVTSSGAGAATFNSLEWSGGDISGKVTATGAAANVSGGAKTIGSTGDLTIAGGSTTDAPSVWTGNVSNAGKLTHASGHTDVTSSFTNTGTLTAGAGTLKLSGGGSSSGNVTIGSGAEVELGGNFTVSGGNITGSSGRLKLTGNATFSGTSTSDSEFAIAGGTTSFSGTHTGSGKLRLSGGTIVSDVGGGATFNSLDWSGGTISGKVSATGAAANVSGGAKTIGSTGDLTIAGGSTTGAPSVWSGNVSNAGKLTHASGHTDVASSFTNTGTLTAGGGTLKLSGGGSSSGNVTIGSGAEVELGGNFTVSGGNITGSSGRLKLTGNATFSGTSTSDSEFAVASGTTSFSGTHAGSGKLRLSGGTIVSDVGGGATFNSLDWSGGTISGKVSATGAAANVSGGAKTIGSTGDLTIAGGNTTDAPSVWTGNVSNAGKLTHASGHTDVTSSFTNTGTVTAGAGTLKLSGGGSSSGQVSIGNGAEVHVGGADFTFSGTISGSGGRLKLLGNTTTFNGTTSDTEIHVGGGVAMFTGAHTGSGKLNLASGMVGGTGAATFNALDWSGGTISGKVTATANAANVSGNAKTIASGGDLTVAGGATSASIWTGGLLNEGKLTHATGLTHVASSFTNRGIFSVNSGKVQLGGGTSSAANATFLIAAGAQLEISSDFDLHGTAELKGLGTARLVNGTFTANGTLEVATFDFIGGALNGNHSFAGTVNWNTSDWSASAGASSTTIAAGAILNIANAGSHDFNRRSITNQGTVNWQAGNLRGGNGSVFTNNGVFNDVNGGTKVLQAPGGFGGSASFVNNGQFNKSAGGTTTIEVPFTNNGAVNVSAGSVIFSSTFTNSSTASAVFSTPVTFGAGGTLRGSGTITAPTVTAGGVFAPGSSPGTMNITGDLTLLATSTLLLELGGTVAGVSHDFINVSGAAIVAGNVSVSFVNGFVPSGASDTFTVLTAQGAAGLTGLFTNVAPGGRLFTADGLGSFQVNYGGGLNSLVLTNFQPVPEPSTWAMLGIGALVVLAGLRRRKR